MMMRIAILQRYSAVVRNVEGLLLGLTGCNVVGRECLVCCVKLVKCVLEQLTVVMHIAIGSRYSKIQKV